MIPDSPGGETRVVTGKEAARIMSIDRTSPGYCASVLESCLKNKKLRAECLRLLADAICAANSHSRAGWTVTLYSNGLRFNVGSTEAYTLLDDQLRLLLDPGNGLDPKLSPFLRSSPYKSTPPGTQMLDVPTQKVPAFLESVRGPFLAFIHGASVTKSGKPRRTPYYPSYSSGVVSYLSKFLGTEIPSPDYSH